MGGPGAVRAGLLGRGVPRPPRSKRANMDKSFRHAYFSPRVREEIESWPVDLLARCVAEGFCKAVELLDLLEDHGPLLGSPHSKALGFWACLNSGPEAAVGLAGRSFVIAVAA